MPLTANEANQLMALMIKGDLQSFPNKKFPNRTVLSFRLEGKNDIRTFIDRTAIALNPDGSRQYGWRIGQDMRAPQQSVNAPAGSNTPNTVPVAA